MHSYAKRCGLRKTGYKPNQKARRGRIIWEDANSAGANAAPDGSFPWMASLFLRRPSGKYGAIDYDKDITGREPKGSHVVHSLMTAETHFMTTIL